MLERGDRSCETVAPHAARALALAVIAIALSMGGGCVLRPRQTADEKAKLDAASQAFEAPPAARQLPNLSPEARWRDVLSRAFLANGELEASYFEWKAALARIDEAAVWPNSNVALNFSYMFSSENVKAWNRTTLGVGFDPSMNLSLPTKARAAGREALDAAQEAGERFRAVKFDLQRKVLSAYLDLALTEELIRIQHDNRTLLKLLTDSAADRAEAGGPMQDLFKATIESQRADDELASLEAKAHSMRSMLNGMLARAADAPLILAASLPAPRAVVVDDARLIAAGVAQNPELAALARQVAGRADAIEVARLAYVPDFSPSASITGDVSQTLGIMLMLPTKAPAIRAAIDEAQAMQHSSEAMLRQTRYDRAGTFVATLYSMRNAERQTQLYQRSILPAAQQLVGSSRSAYAAGTIGFADLVDSERMLLMVRRMVAESRIEREERLAELEALAGVDIETLGAPPAGAQAESAPPRGQP
ncbi:MAG TPA: TolC family protein [Steroidobacteraceae bacterium]|nr:TolC family protein [Steroidobacteraceae bacterium]